MEKNEIKIGDHILSIDSPSYPTWTCEVIKITRPRKVYGMPLNYKFVDMKLIEGRLPWGTKTIKGMFLLDLQSGIRKGFLRNLTREKEMLEIQARKMELWKEMENR